METETSDHVAPVRERGVGWKREGERESKRENARLDSRELLIPFSDPMGGPDVFLFLIL